MLDEIYDLDEALTEDDYYDALLYLLGDAYPYLSEEDLEDLLEDMLDQLPDQQAENVLQAVGSIGKKIGAGTLKFATKNPALVKGVLSGAGAVVGGPIGAKLGVSLGKMLAQDGKHKIMPETGKALALMQDPQAQAALTLTTLGVGNGTAPLALNGKKIEIPAALYLRAMIAVAESALKELDRNSVIPPAAYSESLPFPDDVDRQAEWLVEQLLTPTPLLNENYSYLPTQTSLEERQNGSTTVKYSTAQFDTSQLAAGENPNKRKYISILGPDKRNLDPVRFLFNIINTNTSYNLKDPFLNIRLLAELTNGTQNPIPLQGQVTGKAYKGVSLAEIEDETTNPVQINIDLNALREAMKYFIANNDQSHKLLLEMQLNWKEGNWPGYDYFVDTVYYSFYLMDLVEIVIVDSNIDSSKIDNPIQAVKKLITENTTSSSIEITITTSAKIAQSTTQQVQTSQSQSTTDGQSHTTSVKQTSSNESEVQLGLKLDEIVNAGFKSKRTDSIETAKSITISSSLSKTISTAYSKSDTFTQELSKTVSQKMQLSPPSKGKKSNSLYVYPKFKPIEVDIYDYTDVGSGGFVRSRKIFKKVIMWKYMGPIFETIEI